MQPYYLIMRLPDSERDEFVLLLPFSPANTAEHGVVAGGAERRRPVWGAGELRVPRGASSSTGRSRWRRGSTTTRRYRSSSRCGARWGQQVLRGNLLVVPMDNTILYVEPVFLQADSLAFPELKQIIVADAGEVVMRPTLRSALDGAVRDRAPLRRRWTRRNSARRCRRRRQRHRSAMTIQEALDDATDAIDALGHGAGGTEAVTGGTKQAGGGAELVNQYIETEKQYYMGTVRRQPVVIERGARLAGLGHGREGVPGLHRGLGGRLPWTLPAGDGVRRSRSRHRR